MPRIDRMLTDLLAEPLRAHRRRKRLREIERHPARALTVWRRPRSAQLFYIFHGFELRLMMDPVTVLRETGLIQRNLVMLRDYYKFYYHAGLNASIPDVDAIDERLRACRSELDHVRRTYCLGTSSGGYAAILFGHRLGVDEVFAFAPQTVLEARALRRISGRKDTWRIPEAHRDLASLLSRPNGVTRYHVFYSPAVDLDREFAEHIGGCDGVQLHPQPGDSHTVLQQMLESGALQEIMPAALDA